MSLPNKENKKKPMKAPNITFEFKDKKVYCKGEKNSVYQYALANDRGEIVDKSHFTHQTEINLGKLPNGPYKVVVINEKINEEFGFYLK